MINYNFLFIAVIILEINNFLFYKLVNIVIDYFLFLVFKRRFDCTWILF